MKKYMIRTDMEGVSGVVNEAQVAPGGSEYAFGREMYMSDLLALINGLQAGGADEVVVYDQHYYGRNTDLTRLPADVKVICGKPPYRADWAGGLDESFSAMIMLGLHAMEGTPRALLSHTYEPEIAELRINDVKVGEIGMEAAVAGDFNVPLLLVVADSAGGTEAEALRPGILTVSVKESLDAGGAACYPPAATAEAIHKAARGLVNNPPEVTPFRQESPVRLDVVLKESPYLETMRKLYGERLRDRHTVCLEGPTATAVWAEYWQLKLHCQAKTANENRHT